MFFDFVKRFRSPFTYPIWASSPKDTGMDSGFQFSARSLRTLSTVDERLRKVARCALKRSTVDFAVVQGNRTLDEQKRLYGKGRTPMQCLSHGVPAAYAQPDEERVTWTLNSNHIGGNAIDIAPYVNGCLEWDNSGRLGLWPLLADAFKQAADELGIPIEWGGDWEETKDRPHFQLAR